jgi:hypothetical protein
MLILAVALAATSSAILISRLDNSDEAIFVEEVKTFMVEAPGLGSLVTWENRLAWMTISDPSGKNARVEMHDLDEGKTRVIAEGLYAGGISWVRGSKDTVAYVAFDSLPCDDTDEKERQASGCAGKPRPWKLMAADVKSGKAKQIAKSSNEIQQTYPILPEIEWPWVIWPNPPSEPGLRPTSRGIVVYDLRNSKSKVLVPAAITGKATINEGNVIFSAAVPSPNKWDLFTVSADGSKPSRKLTSSGKVFLPRAANRLIAWQEPIKNAPDAGADSAIWTLPINGKDEPTRLSGRGNNPFPGDGFVVWLASPKQGGQLLFSGVSKSKQPEILEPYPSFGPGWWADGDRVVWSTVNQSKDKPVSMIHIAKVD